MAVAGPTCESEHLDVTLTEDDVPEAKLQPPFDQHTVPQLRRWLLCRGVTAGASLKKNCIIDK